VPPRWRALPADCSRGGPATSPAGSTASYRIRELHLACAAFYVDARLVRLSRRWIASADTHDGPSLGYGDTAFAALWMALAPFDGVIDELLTTVPDDALGG
jgi:hypothetical protein